MTIMDITVTGLDARVTKLPTLTSGTVGAMVRFTFDEVWEGYHKTAVFRCGQTVVPSLCFGDVAEIPWEALEKPGCTLHVGVFGNDGHGHTLPTVWVSTGKVEPGTTVPEETAKEPAADIYGQILSVAKNAEQTANALREDALAGKFTPQKGVDYWTPTEREEMLLEMIAALPTYKGEVENL